MYFMNPLYSTVKNFPCYARWRRNDSILLLVLAHKRHSRYSVRILKTQPFSEFIISCENSFGSKTIRCVSAGKKTLKWKLWPFKNEFSIRFTLYNIRSAIASFLIIIWGWNPTYIKRRKKFSYAEFRWEIFRSRKEVCSLSSYSA